MAVYVYGLLVVLGLALGYGLDDRGSRFRLPAGAGKFSLSPRPERLWGPPNHNEYQELFPWG
jgi:hypothetical protein